MTPRMSAETCAPSTRTCTESIWMGWMTGSGAAGGAAGEPPQARSAAQPSRAAMRTATVRIVGKDTLRWRMRSHRRLMLVAAMSGAAAAGRPAPSAAPAIVHSELIYEQAAFPSAHASTIVETREGLVAAWFGGRAEGDPEVGIWLARRDGARWSAPVEVATGLQPDGTRHPCWNPVLFQPRRGPLLLFYKVGPSPREWWGEVRTSAD